MTNTYKEFHQKYNISKFKIFENNNWIVSLRPEQKTPFSLLLTIKSDKNELRSLNEIEMVDLIESYNFIETLSYDKLGAIKVNYLCLMMVDSIVHYHVFPRFGEILKVRELLLKDQYFPKPVDMSDGKFINLNDIFEIFDFIKG
jgi:diadenosine tetraphosphate (Ap4A) HIT family hydrolase